jgi:hypothetical protein
MGRLQSLAAAGAFPLLLLPATAEAQSPCGSEATVAEGESLADVADRCDVSLSALLDANPDLRTTEVPAGTEVDMPAAPNDRALDRAGKRLKEVGRDIEDAATRAGQSVSEYLSNNPDLNRDILEWGEWIGLPGVSPKPQVGADVTLSPNTGQAGDEIVLRASGLRGDTEVRIGVGPPESEYKILRDGRTTREGELEETIIVPQLAANQDALVFVVETDRVRLISEPFDLVPK